MVQPLVSAIPGWWDGSSQGSGLDFTAEVTHLLSMSGYGA